MKKLRRSFCAALSPELIHAYNQQILIRVDAFDRPLGPIPMFEAHRTESLDAMILHRAFSLFVVDGRRRLLFQQRSASKITYPLHWSNAVCSHPLLNLNETEEQGGRGVKLAARRRLFEELGVRHEPLDDFAHLGTFMYQDRYSLALGESELDHVVLLQRELGAAELARVNPREVRAVEWVAPEDVLSFLAGLRARGERYTPWLLPALSHVLHSPALAAPGA